MKADTGANPSSHGTRSNAWFETILLDGAGGIRTLTVQVKSLQCCRYTTTPFGWLRVTVLIEGGVSSVYSTMCYSNVPVVANGTGSRRQGNCGQETNSAASSQRTTLLVGRRALESLSTVLQTVAKPSQLPTRMKIRAQKKPGVVY